MADDLTECLTGWLTAEGVTAYLVGGYVRDLLLDRPIYDIDVAVDGDAVAVGRRVANVLGGAFYVLDADRGTARVLAPATSGTVREIDFARLKDGNLLADLSARDFTVNAMAMIPGDRDPAHIIDPHDGRFDLHDKRLRTVSATSFSDDPIRILRALRLSGELGLQIDTASAALMQDATPLLAGVSVERIRDEWCRIVCLPSAGRQLTIMHDTGILWAILQRWGIEPPNPGDRKDRWARAIDELVSLSTLLTSADDMLDHWYGSAIEAYRAQLLAHLAKFIADHRSRLLLLRLTALLEPLLGGDALLAVLTELHFSSAEVRRARTLCEGLAAPADWVLAGEVSRGMLHRFYRQTGDCGLDVLVLHLARVPEPARTGEGMAGAHVRLVRRALQAYFEEYATIVAPRRLIDGNMLLAHFGLRPGPHLRTLLDNVSEAQAEGQVTSTEEALHWVERLLAGDRMP